MSATEKLVQRFLTWPLPSSVCSDVCTTRPNYKGERTGTNLLTADEAQQMIEYVLQERTTDNAADVGRPVKPHRSSQEVVEPFDLPLPNAAADTQHSTSPVSDSPTQPAAPVHHQTDECGFDRDASLNESEYVCLCGYRTSDNAAGHLATVPERESNSSRQPENTVAVPAAPTQTSCPWTKLAAARFGRLIFEWTACGEQKVTDIVPTDFARSLERLVHQQQEALTIGTTIMRKEALAAYVALKQEIEK